MRTPVLTALLGMGCNLNSTGLDTDELFVFAEAQSHNDGTSLEVWIQQREGIGAQKLRLETSALLELSTSSLSVSLDWDVFSRSYIADFSENVSAEELQLTLSRPDWETVSELDIQLRSPPEIDGLSDGEEIQLSQWTLDVSWPMDTVDEDLSGSDVLTLMVQADVDEDGGFDGTEDLTLYDSEPLDLGSETLVLTEWTDSAPIVNSTACRLSLIRPSIGSVDDSLAGGGFVGNVRRSVDFVFDP